GREQGVDGRLPTGACGDQQYGVASGIHRVRVDTAGKQRTYLVAAIGRNGLNESIIERLRARRRRRKSEQRRCEQREPPDATKVMAHAAPLQKGEKSSARSPPPLGRRRCRATAQSPRLHSVRRRVDWSCHGTAPA